MWSQLLKIASLSKGALVVGVAASAALVSNAEFSNTPSHNEVASATPIVSTAPVTGTPRPTTSPSSSTEPKKSDAPATQPPGGSPTASPSTAALQHGAVPAIFKECVERYLAIRAQGDSAPTADRQAVGEICKAAFAQSGLTPTEFWAKFGPDTKTPSPTTGPTVTADLEALVKECIAQRQAGTADASDACHQAIAASGLTPQEFWTKFDSSLNTTTHEFSPEVMHWVQECVTKYANHASDYGDTCKKAIELTGLTSAQFFERFLKTTRPTTTPSTKPATAELEQLIYVCRKLQGAITDSSTSQQLNAASSYCDRAIAASGLSTDEFWKKWTVLKPTASPTPTPSTNPATAELEQLIYVCRKLQGAITDSSTSEQFNAASSYCDRAIAASGLSTDEFWKKWYPIKPATAPASTPVPTVKPVTNSAELSQLVAKCLDLYKTITSTGGDTKAASDACRIAIQASGMSSADFWAKYHPTTATN